MLPLEDGERNPYYIWQISDITSERDDQERFFKELQNAIDYLDHAPAGFFSAERRARFSTSTLPWPTGWAWISPSFSRDR